MSQTLNCVDLLKILLLRCNVVGFRSNRASDRWREQGREEDREEGRGAESENLRFRSYQTSEYEGTGGNRRFLVRTSE
ncbi:unnamed protein product [Sphagnum jensenii]